MWRITFGHFERYDSGRLQITKLGREEYDGERKEVVGRGEETEGWRARDCCAGWHSAISRAVILETMNSQIRKVRYDRGR